MSRFYPSFHSFAMGPMVHVTLRRTQAKFFGDDPAPLPDDPPLPLPDDEPLPLPDDEPLPLPDDDPDPIPPDDDYLYDEPLYPGPLVLVNAKGASSHKGRWWHMVDDATLDAWEIASRRHLDRTLWSKGSEYRAGVVFCLAFGTANWALVKEYVLSRGGVVIDT